MAVTPETAALVKARDLVCRFCRGLEYGPGLTPQWRYVLHHVAPRGMGGPGNELLRAEGDSAGNLVLLDDLCHRVEVHGKPQQARALGLLASKLGQVRPSPLLGSGVTG